ncbi:hypothetical protein BWI96_11815 [Siphonobacter sp. SORGH_AS_0500]|uniref:DUF4236 domain-containing protein n=1 Tax=Siphonobacter sp. SORGH_AS_0500 TaxID=1864824 RepID=UPI000CC5D844|nr:DUF4236 domain-containing protein [Siphonobacter sp. SORGH_AS_0500]PKK36534.1 hypothetical protein BWI96_11815 [Siphonobacter sp. SORGH_AS_0500]
MAWRFRKSVKIIPGVRLNFSSKGVSTSIGIRGAGVNFSGRGVYGYASIPGTGISYRERLDKPGASPSSYVPEESPVPSFTSDLPDNIISVDVQQITSQDMQGIKDLILSTHEQRNSIAKSIREVRLASFGSKFKLACSYAFLLGFFNKKLSESFKGDIASQKEILEALKEQEKNSFVKLEVEFDPTIQAKFDRMQNAFKVMAGSHKIWDRTSSYYHDRKKTRSAASRIVTRKQTYIGLKTIPDIMTDYEPFFFKNINGADLYFYPSFMIAYRSRKELAVVGYDELKFLFSPTRFVETESVPKDSKVIEYTWAKVNKNGSRDKRFKGNYQIPIARYGNIELRSNTGLNEQYEFSNYEAAEEFAYAFLDYQKTIINLKALQAV